MYNAPLYNRLLALATDKKHFRFHMPGHKGCASGSVFDGIFPIDYTEIPPTGNLYDESGIIQEAEALAAAYYGSDRCFFLTCGATQGIKAAISAVCPLGSSLVVDRNCHKSVSDAMAILDLRPTYISPNFNSDFGVTCGLSPSLLCGALKKSGAPAAIVTSPTYYGVSLDISALAAAAHSCGALLIVDSAHGSHLRACGASDAISCGADLVIFSAHKTLLALTQGAYLLASHASLDFYERLRAATSLFGTTSPSYPIMASLDFSRAWLETNADAYKSAAERSKCLLLEIEKQTPFKVLPSDDPCRFVVCTAFGGVNGYSAADFIRTQGIEPEMQDDRNVVLIITPFDTDIALAAVLKAFSAIPHAASALCPAALPPPLPAQALSPRTAYFGAKKTVNLCESIGAVAAQTLAPYPPGVPVISYGERIDKICIEYLVQKGYNGNSKISIVGHT